MKQRIYLYLTNLQKLYTYIDNVNEVIDIARLKYLKI